MSAFILHGGSGPERSSRSAFNCCEKPDDRYARGSCKSPTIWVAKKQSALLLHCWTRRMVPFLTPHTSPVQ